METFKSYGFALPPMLLTTIPGESALKSEAGSRAAEVRLLLLKEGAILTAGHSVEDS